MKRVRITQIKSGINRPERQKRILLSLGLKRMHQTVEHDATPQILGMANAISHLVKIEEI